MGRRGVDRSEAAHLIWDISRGADNRVKAAVPLGSGHLPAARAGA